MADKIDKNLNNESCDCDPCREDRHRRELVPLWDFVRCFMKIRGVRYDENQKPGPPQKNT